MSSIPAWAMYAAGSAFFAALTALFGKIGVAGIPSNLATLIRTAVILVLTGLVVAARSEWQAPNAIARASWLALVLSGIASGLSWLCYYRALQLGPVSKVAPVDKLSVAIAILLGVFVLGEQLTWQLALGSFLIVAGTMIIILL